MAGNKNNNVGKVDKKFWITNLARSMGNVGLEAFKTEMPDLAEFIVGMKDINKQGSFHDIFQSLKNVVSTVRKNVWDDTIVKGVKTAVNNVTTGNIYDPDAMASAMGMGFDNEDFGGFEDFGGEDFGGGDFNANGEEEFSSTGTEVSNVSTGNTYISGGQSTPEAEKAKAVIANKLSSGIDLMIGQNIIDSLGRIYQANTRMIEFSGNILKPYLDRSLENQDKQIQLLSAIGLEMNKMTAMYQPKEDQQEYKAALTLAEKIDKWTSETLGEDNMFIMGIRAMAANPFGMLLDSLIPEKMRKDMRFINSRFKNIPMKALMSMSSKSDEGGLMGMIGNFFKSIVGDQSFLPKKSIEQEVGEKAEKEKETKKNATPFDNESHKTLNDIIPFYLAKIEVNTRELKNRFDSDDEFTYDWDSGYYNTKGAVNKARDDKKKKSLYDLGSNTFGAIKGKSGKSILEYIDAYIEKEVTDELKTMDVAEDMRYDKRRELTANKEKNYKKILETLAKNATTKGFDLSDVAIVGDKTKHGYGDVSEKFTELFKIAGIGDMDSPEASNLYKMFTDNSGGKSIFGNQISPLDFMIEYQRLLKEQAPYYVKNTEKDIKREQEAGLTSNNKLTTMLDDVKDIRKKTLGATGTRNEKGNTTFDLQIIITDYFKNDEAYAKDIFSTLRTIILQKSSPNKYSENATVFEWNDIDNAFAYYDRYVSESFKENKYKFGNEGYTKTNKKIASMASRKTNIQQEYGFGENNIWKDRIFTKMEGFQGILETVINKITDFAVTLSDKLENAGKSVYKFGEKVLKRSSDTIDESNTSTAKSTGGKIDTVIGDKTKFKKGGKIKGNRRQKADIPYGEDGAIYVQKGEYVIRKDAVDAIEEDQPGVLDDVNQYDKLKKNQLRRKGYGVGGAVMGALGRGKNLLSSASSLAATAGSHALNIGTASLDVAMGIADRIVMAITGTTVSHKLKGTGNLMAGAGKFGEKTVKAVTAHTKGFFKTLQEKAKQYRADFIKRTRQRYLNDESFLKSIETELMNLKTSEFDVGALIGRFKYGSAATDNKAEATEENSSIIIDKYIKPVITGLPNDSITDNSQEMKIIIMERLLAKDSNLLADATAKSGDEAKNDIMSSMKNIQNDFSKKVTGIKANILNTFLKDKLMPVKEYLTQMAEKAKDYLTVNEFGDTVLDKKKIKDAAKGYYDEKTGKIVDKVYEEIKALVEKGVISQHELSRNKDEYIELMSEERFNELYAMAKEVRVADADKNIKAKFALLLGKTIKFGKKVMESPEYLLEVGKNLMKTSKYLILAKARTGFITREVVNSEKFKTLIKDIDDDNDTFYKKIQKIVYERHYIDVRGVLKSVLDKAKSVATFGLKTVGKVLFKTELALYKQQIKMGKLTAADLNDPNKPEIRESILEALGGNVRQYEKLVYWAQSVERKRNSDKMWKAIKSKQKVSTMWDYIKWGGLHKFGGYLKNTMFKRLTIRSIKKMNLPYETLLNPEVKLRIMDQIDGDILAYQEILIHAYDNRAKSDPKAIKNALDKIESRKAGDFGWDKFKTWVRSKVNDKIAYVLVWNRIRAGNLTREQMLEPEIKDSMIERFGIEKYMKLYEWARRFETMKPGVKKFLATMSVGKMYDMVYKGLYKQTLRIGSFTARMGLRALGKVIKLPFAAYKSARLEYVLWQIKKGGADLFEIKEGESYDEKFQMFSAWANEHGIVKDPEDMAAFFKEAVEYYRDYKMGLIDERGKRLKAEHDRTDKTRNFETSTSFFGMFKTKIKYDGNIDDFGKDQLSIIRKEKLDALEKYVDKRLDIYNTTPNEWIKANIRHGLLETMLQYERFFADNGNPEDPNNARATAIKSKIEKILDIRSEAQQAAITNTIDVLDDKFGVKNFIPTANIITPASVSATPEPEKPAAISQPTPEVKKQLSNKQKAVMSNDIKKRFDNAKSDITQLKKMINSGKGITKDPADILKQHLRRIDEIEKAIISSGMDRSEFAYIDKAYKAFDIIPNTPEGIEYFMTTFMHSKLPEPVKVEPVTTVASVSITPDNIIRQGVLMSAKTLVKRSIDLLAKYRKDRSMADLKSYVVSMKTLLGLIAQHNISKSEIDISEEYKSGKLIPIDNGATLIDAANTSQLDKFKANIDSDDKREEKAKAKIASQEEKKKAKLDAVNAKRDEKKLKIDLATSAATSTWKESSATSKEMLEHDAKKFEEVKAAIADKYAKATAGDVSNAAKMEAEFIRSNELDKAVTEFEAKRNAMEAEIKKLEDKIKQVEDKGELEKKAIEDKYKAQIDKLNDTSKQQKMEADIAEDKKDTAAGKAERADTPQTEQEKKNAANSKTKDAIKNAILNPAGAIDSTAAAVKNAVATKVADTLSGFGTGLKNKLGIGVAGSKVSKLWDGTKGFAKKSLAVVGSGFKSIAGLLTGIPTMGIGAALGVVAGVAALTYIAYDFFTNGPIRQFMTSVGAGIADWSRGFTDAMLKDFYKVLENMDRVGENMRKQAIAEIRKGDKKTEKAAIKLYRIYMALKVLAQYLSEAVRREDKATFEFGDSGMKVKSFPLSDTNILILSVKDLTTFAMDYISRFEIGNLDYAWVQEQGKSIYEKYNDEIEVSGIDTDGKEEEIAMLAVEQVSVIINEMIMAKSAKDILLMLKKDAKMNKPSQDNIAAIAKDAAVIDKSTNVKASAASGSSDVKAAIDKKDTKSSGTNNTVTTKVKTDNYTDGNKQLNSGSSASGTVNVVTGEKKIPGRASGGKVERSDILAFPKGTTAKGDDGITGISEGEYVIKKDSVKKIEKNTPSLLDILNENPDFFTNIANSQKASQSSNSEVVKLLQQTVSLLSKILTSNITISENTKDMNNGSQMAPIIQNIQNMIDSNNKDNLERDIPMPRGTPFGKLKKSVA